MKHLRVQIPAFNERDTIERVVRDVLAACDGLVASKRVARTSVLLIDDGSTDGTAAIIDRLVAQDARLAVLRHGANVGLGRSFREGVALALEADADYLAHIDADGQFEPAQLPRLVDVAREQHVDLVLGSRGPQQLATPPAPVTHRLGTRALAWLVSRVAGQRFFDVTCGFRVYSRKALERMRLDSDFTYTQQSLLSCVFLGLQVSEVRLDVRGRREHGRSSISSNLPRYALHALVDIARVWVAHQR